MELPIEQALQQGIDAHREGNIKDAEHIYRTILQSQPNHPVANHNLGLIAVSVKKTALALPLFKKALDANPKIGQFWLSYVHALLAEEQFDDAKRALVQAKKQGVDEKKLSIMKARLVSTAHKKNANRANPSQQFAGALPERKIK